ncbi:alginate lyase family protein [Bacillus toyonensis]|uniref:alginate lyase family protein n=1 Tax=Bacillus toyonensis TaxID=155322 RepID=UPI000BF643CF|nr:alginate lyase family protein [Bacillus toyonensis]PGB65232.1 hypothetical protein COM00_07245 [Bacillus toyonensis]
MSRFLQKVRNLKGKSIHLIARKVVRKSYDAIYYKGRKIVILKNLIDLEEEAFKDFQPQYKFIFKSREKLDYVAKLQKISVEEDIIRDADKICKHIFNLLGSGDIQLDKKIPWNKDFKTGFIWENKFYKEIKVIDLQNNADVKVPWELSRFQHVFTLGKAYWITKDEKYALEFKEQIMDWIEKNPIEMSVNWTCTMDIAIRAVNWIAGYYFFKDSREIDNKFWGIFNKSLYMHGRFIYKNLENKGEHTGNHYVSNIVGLVWLGLYFKGFSLSSAFNINTPEKWLAYGVTELEKEMFVQVNEDGTNYEASTSYHRLVAELFLITTILCNENNIIFSNEYVKRLENMCEFLMYLNQPNGKSPLIGDADDGRLFIFSKYCSWNKNDFRHLLAIAGEFFNRDDFRYFGVSYREDALWCTGNWEKVEHQLSLESKAFNDGGYYILRNENMYCCVRCGELSFRGQGAHSHNDQLSFTLSINGEDIFIDAGTFTYTADYQARNLFRSTSMHNTLEIPPYEQNDFEKNNLFEMREQSFSKCTYVDNNKFIGQHKGYVDKCDVIHERSIYLGKSDLNIEDNILGGKNFELCKFNFILDPEVKINIEENEVHILKKHVKVILQVNNNMKIDHETIFVSDGYGKKEESIKLVVKTSASYLETSIVFKNYKGD